MLQDHSEGKKSNDVLGGVGSMEQDAGDEDVQPSTVESVMRRAPHVSSGEEDEEKTDKIRKSEGGCRLTNIGDPGFSTGQEVEEHHLTHVPYRNWCPHCVMGVEAKTWTTGRQLRRTSGSRSSASTLASQEMRRAPGAQCSWGENESLA